MKLVEADDNFRRMYERHQLLKERVSEANAGVTAMDWVELEELKKEKLHLKDKMAAVLEHYRSQAVPA
jgi:hypothetical protein